MSDDHLSNEISIAAKIEDRSLTIGARSRFVSAVDRLLGSVADIPAAYFEDFAKKIRAKGSVELDLIEAEGRGAVDKLTGDPEVGAIIAAEYTRTETRKIENRKKVVEASLEYLEEAEPNTNAEDSNEEIDFDWLNYFEEYAEKASSERMQDLWARVLAGEIRKPTTFSLTTLRFISELDQEIANKFQKVTNFASIDGIVISPKNLSGDLLADFSLLQEVGLLTHVGGMVSQTLTKDSEGKLFRYHQNLCLVMEANRDLKISIVPLSRTGKEVMSILPPSDPKLFLKAVYEAAKNKVTSASIMQIVEKLPDGGVRLENVELLKAPPTSQTS